MCLVAEIFYNGVKEAAEKEIQRLSDVYINPSADPNLELRVTVLNINEGYNPELMEKCRTLHEYMILVSRIRKYSNEMPLANAAERAVNECIREDILADFLRKNKSEVIRMGIFEYDEEKHMQQIREEGREEGIQETILNNIRNLLESLHVCNYCCSLNYTFYMDIISY